jgi:SAM-dependent methyltransferase
MTPETPYSSEFFAHHQELSRQSARAVIPMLFEFVRPRSVVDVGCGVGTWLAEFQLAGVNDYFGVDGDYVDRSKLLIDAGKFRGHDLTTPLELGRRFDLALSMEVAEHLPEKAAAAFVGSLVRAAPVVLFSAAIPQQPGTGHINGQWPDYWFALFADHGYQAVDCLRQRLWDDSRIAWWYRQNTFVYVDRQMLADYPRLAAEISREQLPQRVVHPDHYLTICGDLASARKVAVSQSLRLRATSLAVFPDWRTSDSELIAQLQAMFIALISRADREQLSLVMHIGSESPERVQQVINRINASLPAELLPLASAGPHVAVVDAQHLEHFGELIGPCLQGRIILAGEDTQAVKAAGATQVPSWSTMDVKMGKMPAQT